MQNKAKPTLLMEYYKDGQLVGQGAPDLPAPETDGSIPYIATTPTAAFPPGEYRMAVEIAQGEAKVRRAARFVVTE